MPRYVIVLQAIGFENEEEAEAQRRRDEAARLREAAIATKRAELVRNWAPASTPGKPVIEVDASRWTSYKDLYGGILPRLGSTHDHSCSLDALMEWMVWGGMNNALEPLTRFGSVAPRAYLTS